MATIQRLTEDQARDLLVEAEGYLELGLHAEALKRIEAVAATPHLPYEAAALRGEYHRSRGEHAEAIPFFREALRLRPGDVAATVGLGWCEKRVGRVDLAAAAYKEALKLAPREGILHYNLACYESLLGQEASALGHLAAAVKIDPRFRAMALEESDFDPIRVSEGFRRLTRRGESGAGAG